MTLPVSQSELDGLRSLDTQATAAVYIRYYPYIYRFLHYRLSDKALAEDNASEVFVRLLEAIKGGHAPQTNLKAWLLATASHLAVDCLRSSYRHPISELSEIIPDGTPDPLQDIEHQACVCCLMAAMAQLTGQQQAVLALRFGGEYSLEQTAGAMKKNINAVKQLQFRALAALMVTMPDCFRKRRTVSTLTCGMPRPPAGCSG